MRRALHHAPEALSKHSYDYAIVIKSRAISMQAKDIAFMSGSMSNLMRAMIFQFKAQSMRLYVVNHKVHYLIGTFDLIPSRNLNKILLKFLYYFLKWSCIFYEVDLIKLFE